MRRPYALLPCQMSTFKGQMTHSCAGADQDRPFPFSQPEHSRLPTGPFAKAFSDLRFRPFLRLPGLVEIGVSTGAEGDT
jgi:hypothetical protein